MKLNIMNLNNNSGVQTLPSLKVAALTRDEIIAAARRLRSTRSTKWTVLIEGRELPVRPLILEAAGVPPNDATNSHQAVKILEEKGFDVRYEGKAMSANARPQSPAEMEGYIRSLRGFLKGESSIAEARERGHRLEK
jgi:hypothetical protein